MPLQGMDFRLTITTLRILIVFQNYYYWTISHAVNTLMLVLTFFELFYCVISVYFLVFSEATQLINESIRVRKIDWQSDNNAITTKKYQVASIIPWKWVISFPSNEKFHSQIQVPFLDPAEFFNKKVELNAYFSQILFGCP